MAGEAISLEFLGEQLKHVQADIRDLKGRVLLLDSDQEEFRRDLKRVETKIDVLSERTAGRFDQVIELIKSSFRALNTEIQELKQRPSTT